MSENYRQSEIGIVVNDKSQGMRCGVLSATTLLQICCWVCWWKIF